MLIPARRAGNPLIKPAHSLKLDRSNPINQGIAGCWLPGEGKGFVQDLCGFNHGQETGSDWERAFTAYGQGGFNDTNASTGRIALGSIDSTNPLSFSDSQAFTILAHLDVSTSVTPHKSQFPRIFDKSTGGSAGGGYAFYIDTTANTLALQISGGSLWQQSISGLDGVGTLMATFSKADNEVKLYHNGILLATKTSPAPGSETIVTTTANAQIGNWYHSNDRQHGTPIFLIRPWQRALNEEEAYLVGVDPYYGLVSRRVWISTQASAASGSVGSSTGTSTASGVGTAKTDSVGSSTGSSTALADGAASSEATASSTGTSTVSGVGALLKKAVGSSTGTATASGVGTGQNASVGSSTGTSTASAVGTELGAGSIGSSTGSSTASGVSASTAESPGASTGTSTATAVGAALLKSVGSSTGSSTAAAIAAFGGAGSSTGSSTAVGVGQSLSKAVGSSEGTSTCLAASPLLGLSVPSTLGGSGGGGYSPLKAQSTRELNAFIDSIGEEKQTKKITSRVRAKVKTNKLEPEQLEKLREALGDRKDKKGLAAMALITEKLDKLEMEEEDEIAAIMSILL